MSFEDSYNPALGNPPVVLDNGTGFIKAGLAGDNQPKAVFPSYVGRPKHTKVMAGAIEGEQFMGSKAQELRGLLKIKYPMEHGIVRDWGDMEKVWSHVYQQELQVQSEDHPLLLTEAPLNPLTNRERAAETFFETFRVPAMFISIQAVLSLYSSGRTTGVVLDSGDGVTHAVPVVEGYAIPHAITRVDIAGRDVTDYLQVLLRKAGHTMYTSAERETVRDIKEKACYVAYNLDKEEVLSQEKRQNAFQYRLPDGTVMDIGPERYRAPEIMFNPSIIGSEELGIQDCLVSTIHRCDLDLRKTLYSQIVLSGGSTFFHGFGDRLLHEVKRRAPKDVRIKISAPPDRKYSAWVGGSILASLATFKKMWVSSAEYQEEGSAVIHRKTFG